MKLSFKIPTWLFLIVIVLLVLFVLYKICSSSEGFINYNSSSSDLSKHMLPNTDASGHKLYDNNYFYPGTGKLIRVWGTEEGVEGEDIDYVDVYSRDDGSKSKIDASYSIEGDKKVYTLDEDVAVAGDIYQLPLLYTHWYTKDVPDTYSGWTNNQVFYVNYGSRTYIHVIDASDNTHHGFLQSQEVLSSVEYTNPMTVGYKKCEAGFGSGSVNDITVGGKKIYDSYHVSDNVYYNINTGDLCINTTDETSEKLSIYKRDGTSIESDVYESSSSSNDTLSNISSANGFIVQDNLGGKLIVYVSFQKTTIIMVLCKQEDDKNGAYSLEQNTVFRFDENGLVQFDTGSSSDESSSSSDESSSGSSSGSDESSSDSPPVPDGSGNMNEYWKWYWYWNSNNTPMGGFSNDYMLKTQMVPPVCPACPACPNGGNCNNCGGNGGSGTVDAYGNTVVKSNLSGVLDNTVTTTGNIANKTLDTTSDLLKSAGSGALELTNTLLDSTGNLVSGTGDIIRDTASGTVDLAKDTVTGTVDLAKDTVSGTADFVRDMGSGNYNNGSGTTSTYGYGNNNTSGGSQHGMSASGGDYLSPAMDPYTYNGRLQQRPESVYVPLTNSFAAFGK